MKIDKVPFYKFMWGELTLFGKCTFGIPFIILAYIVLLPFYLCFSEFRKEGI